MGREVRRVPADWQGVIRENGTQQPHYDRTYREACEEWKASFLKWEAGERDTYWTKGEDPEEYWDWEGMPPDINFYRPEWTDEQRTHLMMYEDTTEGTPISPPFETPEELARWLTDNNASAFGNMTATYEQWLATCKGGWAPSAVYSPSTGMISGVAASNATQPPTEHGACCSHAPCAKATEQDDPVRCPSGL